jgi:3-hydroxybutyryl-CoA dehydratase
MSESDPTPQSSPTEETKGLPVVVKHISQEKVNLYAEASGDFNPIHIDEDFAKTTPLGGTIAHGMLILAYVSQMMTAAFGESWLSGGKLNVRFKTPARPGDTVTVSGKVRTTERKGNETSVTYDVLCQNQKGETIITGEASVRLSQE